MNQETQNRATTPSLIDIARRLAQLSPEKRRAFRAALRKQGMDDSDLPIVPQPEALQANVPLSFAQQRLWFLDQLEGGSTAYNICTAQRLLGSLNAPALRAAFVALQQRHASLRMAIIDENGSAHLRIDATGELPWRLVDLSMYEETERETRLQTLASECAQIRFDLAKSPLWQLTLAHLADGEHALFLTLHHIIADGWSLDVLVSELAELYAGFCANQTISLEPTPINYADYACWQRGWLQGETLDAQIDYWRNVLGAGGQPVLALPTDKARPAQFSQRGAEYTFHISVEATRRLRELARAEGRTLFSLMLTAFQTLLYRYTGQTDLRVGTPVANRTRAETQGLVGLFANTLVVRASPTSDITFTELWAKTASAIINAQAHQDVPFEKLVDLLQPERDLSRSPLFQVMYLQQAKTIASELPGLRLLPLATKRETSKFDLTLEVLEGAETLEASFVYATDLFELATIERMASHFRILLDGIVNNAATSLAQLPLLAAIDKQQLTNWNSTGIAYADQTLPHQRFEQLAISQPHAPALYFENNSLSYAELNNRANQLANFLRDHGIGVDDVVGVCLPRSIDLVVALYGIHKAGAAYLPLDPDYPTDRLDYMSENANAKLLLSRTDNTWVPANVDYPIINMDRDSTQWSTASTQDPGVPVPLDALAYVIYTSGSTGRPKGVACHHRGLINRLEWMQSEYGLTAQDRVLQKTPFSFDVSVWEFFWPLMTGAALVLARPGEHKDAEQLASLIQYHAITTAHFVPSMLRAFLDEPTSIQCKSLQRVICSGEALPGDLAARFQKCLPAGLHNLYGPTEAAIDVSYWACVSEDGSRAVPIGRPIANTTLHILDASLNPVPIGVSGELYIGGVQLARGYLGRRDLTAERFVPDPFASSGARLYRTGDLARWDSDGVIHYLGRLDHQVKIRGFRIELGEIEAQLLAQPEVQDAVVLAREDRPGDKRLVAYWVASGQRESTDRDEDILRARLSDVLPEHMVPASFWRLDAMPLSPNGKLDRKALPAPDYRLAASAFTAPRNTLETILSTVWADVLVLPQVGIHDNFFRSGGDSILSLQVVAKARQQGVRLTPKQMFERQTVAELATVAQLIETRSALTENYVDDGQAWPLTPIQHWFFTANFQNPAHWNQAVLLKLREPVAPEILQTAINWLQQQHPVLNLRLEQGDNGQWQQRIDATNTLPLHIESLAHLNPDEQSIAIQESSEMLQASFNLQQGPLLAAKYFECGHSEPRLLLALHHLLVDGVSWRVLLDDLEQGCRHLLDGKNKPILLSSAPYRKWAEALQKLARTEAVKNQQHYWLAQTSTPFNATGSYGRVGEVARIDFQLDQERTKALLGQAPGKVRAQVDDILLAALAYTFCVEGRESVVIELEGHGREGESVDLDLSRTLGWFTSRFPVCLRPGSADPINALKVIKEQLRAIPDKGMGYGLLRYLGDSSEQQALAALPVPEICFNYLGRFDRVFNEQSLFSLAPESPGATRHASERRTHALDIDGQVLGDCLRMTWTYSSSWLPAQTVEAFARDFQYRLESLIDALLIAPAAVTSSDFPLAKLAQTELDDLALDWAAIADLYPLAPMQYGLLLHTLLNPGAGMYLMQDRYRLQGALNVPAFLAGWTAVVERHAVLRTGFVWNNEERPLQAVYRTVPSPIEYLDWSDEDDITQRTQLDALLAEELHQGFDLAEPRLIRFRLIRLGPDCYYFTQSYHHILIDAWCFSLLMVDFFTLYRALSEGQDAPQLKPVRPYSDFIGWLGAREQHEDRQWWRQKLAGFESPTPLMIMKTPEQRIHSGVEDRSIPLSIAETQALQAEAQKHGLTINTYVQAAWALVLSWYSGQRDILFGVTVAGRPPELDGVEETIGLFINTLPLRLQVAPEIKVGQWLQDLLAQNMELRQYEQLPLSEVQAESPLGRGQSLFDSLFVFENAPVDRSLDEWKERFHIDDKHARTHTNYPITVVIIPGENLVLQLTYDRELFDESAILKLLAHFKYLLLALMHNPETKLANLQHLSTPELEQISVWNNTGSGQDIPDNYARLFEAQVRATPFAIAARCNGVTLNYQELNRRANRIAKSLAATGVGPDSVVALFDQRGLDLLAMILGVFKTGAAYLPLDINHPSQRLAQILRQSNAKAVLVGFNTAQLQDAFDLVINDLAASDQLGNNSLHILNVETLDLENSANDDDVNPPAQGHSNNLGYVIFTSGSTGVPKGAMVDRRGMLNNLLQKQPQLGLTSTDVIAQTASACFDISVWQFLSGLLCGALIEIVPDEIAHDPRGLLQHVADTGVTVLETVPSLLRGILADSEAVEALKLRWVLPTGEALPPDLARDWLNQYPHIPLLNVYGPAECADDVAIHALLTAPGAGAHLPIGLPVANLRLYVLNRELDLLPTGVPGELCIAGVGVGRGYLNDPVRTAQVFIPHPLASTPGERLYRTGDLVRQNEHGVFEYLGRIDHQVKLRGYRIELGEIEARLLALPAVTQAVVTVREDRPGDQKLVAYLVGEANDDDIRAALSESLPQYMVPSVYVYLDSLPLNANGKIDRKALPIPDVQGQLATIELPTGEVEIVLARIWCDVLGVDQVGRHQNFFALGGHSLLATQLASRVRRSLGIELPLRAVFDAPTIAQLGLVLGVSSKDRAPALIPIGDDEPARLSFAQERMWFLHELDPNSGLYNMPMALELNGKLDVAALTNAFELLSRRHSVLRSGIAQDNPPRMISLSLPDFELPIEDLRALPEAIRTTEAHRLSSQEAKQGFDLAHTAPWRARLLRLADDRYWLLLTLHHIAGDGWSLGILTRELALSYGELSAGRKPVLPVLPIQYADYAIWQRQWLEGEVLAKQLAYWRQQLGQQTVTLELPTDRSRPPVQTYNGASLDITLAPELYAALKRVSERHGVTLYMTLLAGFSLLLHRYSGQKDVRIGTPIANRQRVETEGLIGLFANTLVIRSELDSGTLLTDFLHQIRERALGAQANQDLPFEQLVEALQPERDLSRSPFFQAMFILQNAPQEELDLPDLEVNALPVDHGSAKFDLTLVASEQSGGLDASLEYNTDLFDSETAKRFADSWRCLLEQVASEKSTPLDSWEIMTAVERHTLLEVWNPARNVKPQTLLAEAFLNRAKKQPETTAVICGDEQWSYSKLAGEAGRLVVQLRNAGVGPDTLVGVHLHRSPALLAALLAVNAVGGAYVPLDPAYPIERLTWMLTDAKAPVLLTERELVEKLPSQNARVIFVSAILENAEDAALQINTNVQSDHLAYVIYTSGSTGRPKGVAVTQGALANLLGDFQHRLDVGGNDLLLAVTSLSFDIAALELFLPLISGGTVLLAHAEQSADANLLMKLLRDKPVTLMQATPATWRMLLDSGWKGEVRPVRLLCGGEAMAEDLANSLCTRGSELWNVYGPTETTIWSAAHRVIPDTGIPLIGQPLANTDIYVLDDQLSLVPVGVAGELYIGGDGLARGYWGRPDLAAERFLPNPFRSGERMYRTGDVARWRTTGELQCLGRSDRQVKIRGFRMELDEIESVLVGLDGVSQAAVIMVGERAPYLLAFVSPEVGQQLQGDVLRAELGRYLPAYMVPARISILDTLPLTPNGKVDRKALPYGDVKPVSTKPYTAPTNALEALIANVWEDALGVSPLGVHDNFFVMGGHSLLAMRVIRRLRELLGRDLPLTLLFQAPNIFDLARLLQTETPSVSPLLCMRAGSNQLPLFCIHPAGGHVASYQPLVNALDPRLPIYGLQSKTLHDPTWVDQSITSMAEDYVAAVRTVQPHGPYRLLGWSMGGMLALAMASLFEAQGEHIEFIGLLDTTQYVDSELATRHHRANEYLDYLDGLCRGRLDSTGREILLETLKALPTKEQLGFLIAWAKERSLWPDDLDHDAIELQVNLRDESNRLMREHVLTKIQAPIHLWWAEFTLIEHGSTAPGDWAQFTEGGLHTRVIKGNHWEILAAPELHEAIQLLIEQ